MVDYFDNLDKFWTSIGDEIDSLKEKIENLIGYNHLQTSGEYLEEILREIIRRHIPRNFTVGSGFIVDYDKDIDTRETEKRVSFQIDILIFDNQYPILYETNNVYFVPQQSVVGIIEVKKTLNEKILRESLFKMNYNSRILKIPYKAQKIDKRIKIFQAMKKNDDNNHFDKDFIDIFKEILIETKNKNQKQPFIGIFCFNSHLTHQKIKYIIEDSIFPKHDYFVNFIRTPSNKNENFLFIRTEQKKNNQKMWVYPKNQRNFVDKFFFTNLISCLNNRNFEKIDYKLLFPNEKESTNFDIDLKFGRIDFIINYNPSSKNIIFENYSSSDLLNLKLVFNGIEKIKDKISKKTSNRSKDTKWEINIREDLNAISNQLSKFSIKFTYEGEIKVYKIKFDPPQNFDARFKISPKNYWEYEFMENLIDDNDIDNWIENDYLGETLSKYEEDVDGFSGPVLLPRDHTVSYGLTETAELDIKFNCVECHRKIIMEGIEIPKPNMFAESAHESRLYGESLEYECDCCAFYTVTADSSIVDWDVEFEGENAPKSFWFKLNETRG